MTHAPGSLLSWLSFGATLSGGAAGAWIGWQQKRIADRQRQNVEFDRLFGVYLAFSDLVRTPKEEMGKQLNIMNLELRKASLLFDEELHTYLQASYSQAIAYYQNQRPLMPPAINDRAASLQYQFSQEDRNRNQKWMLDQTREMPLRFRAYIHPISKRSTV